MQPPFVFDMNAQSLHLVSRHMYVTNIPQITKGLYGIKSINYVSLAGFKAQLLLSVLNLKFCLHAFFQSILVYEDKESYPLQSEMGFYFRERMLLQWCDKKSRRRRSKTRQGHDIERARFGRRCPLFSV